MAKYASPERESYVYATIGFISAGRITPTLENSTVPPAGGADFVFAALHPPRSPR